jgi:acyl-CoA synthetase (AMP-forming)/AMP-acid ligase II
MVRDPSSLGEALRIQADRQPDAPAVTFVNDGERDETTWTFGELDQRAGAIAVKLGEEGVAQGDRALILHPPGLDLVAAFFGCQYAGVVPTLTYPPTARSGSRSHQRLRRLIEDAQCRILLRGGAERSGLDTSLPELFTDAVDAARAASFRAPAAGLEDTAFLQYTSGSTREPRGVIVLQRNALANLRHIADVSRARSSAVRVVMWVPPYHDLGLVGGILMPIASGFPTHLMNPRHFMQRPIRWLQAISRHRATTTGAPDSAYDACARSARDEDLVGLDLSGWTVAFNGSETVRPETLRRFSERFASCGFRPETFYPCYGLAESTLIVSGGAPGTRWREQRLPVPTGDSRDPAEPGSSLRAAVSMGQAVPGHEILIVSPETGAPCAEGEIGEIWLRGPSVAKGYWNRPAETEATFKARPVGSTGAPYLRTGDLGSLVGGDLLVAGRIKDLVLLHGRNLFPQDIEDTIESSHAAIEPRGSCVFSIDTGSEEILVVLAEIRRTERHHVDVTDVIEAIRRTISREHDVAVGNARLLQPSTLPRTTSGKIQRAEARRLFLAGAFKTLASFDALSTARQPLVLSAESGSLEERLRRRAAALLGVDLEAVPGNLAMRDLGLDSLMRVEFLLALPAGTRDELPEKVLDGAVTLQELAELCREPPPPLPGPVLLVQDGDVPLSPRQRNFLEQPGLLTPERFGIQVRLRTPAGLSKEKIRAALGGLADAHAALRLRFRCKEGQWDQQLSKDSSGEVLAVADIRNVQPGQLRAESAGFDQGLVDGISLEHGPLFRALLLDRGPEEPGILSIFFHHLVTDALSVAILLADLTRSYEASDEGSEARTSIGGTCYVSWCRARAADWAVQHDAMMATAPGRTWTDPALTTGAAACSERASPPGGLDPLTDARLLERFPTSRDVEAVLLAAFAWAFGRVVGTPLHVEIQAHGRWPRSGIDPAFCVGWFASLHALELPVTRDSSDLSLLEAARAALLPVHKSGASPEFAGRRPRTSMEYRSTIEDPFRSEATFPILDVVWWHPPRSVDCLEGDLALVSGHRRGRLWWSLGANPRVYAHSTVLAMATDIRAYLERAAE